MAEQTNWGITAYSIFSRKTVLLPASAPLWFKQRLFGYNGSDRLILPLLNKAMQAYIHLQDEPLAG